MSSNPRYDVSEDTIFITNLPEDTTEEQLKEYFGQIGVIKFDKKNNCPKIWIYKDKTTGKGKGEATLTYDDPPTATSAIQWFNGKEFRGSQLTIELARRKAAPQFYRGGGGGGGGGRGGYRNNHNNFNRSGGGGPGGGGGHHQYRDQNRDQAGRGDYRDHHHRNSGGYANRDRDRDHRDRDRDRDRDRERDRDRGGRERDNRDGGGGGGSSSANRTSGGPSRNNMRDKDDRRSRPY